MKSRNKGRIETERVVGARPVVIHKVDRVELPTARSKGQIYSGLGNYFSKCGRLIC